jgi:hypothetical protein
MGNGLRGLGSALEISQGCITYFDPNTGEAINDPNTNCLPYDTGEGDAVAQWAASQRADQNSALLNAALQAGNANTAQAATGVCGALGIPCPTNIPSPFSASTSLLLVVGLAIVALIAVKK